MSPLGLEQYRWICLSLSRNSLRHIVDGNSIIVIIIVAIHINLSSIYLSIYPLHSLSLPLMLRTINFLIFPSVIAVAAAAENISCQNNFGTKEDGNIISWN